MFSTTAFTVGVVVIALSSPWRNEVLAPGDLSLSHAQIIRRAERADRCATCHPAARHSPAMWVTAAIGDRSVFGAEQSQLCLGCHQTELDPQFALAPHGLPADRLRALQPAVAVKRQFAGGQAAKRLLDERLSCAACHREHHGTSFDLTQMANEQCASCHQRQFSSLADHPEFSMWPHRRRTRIAFDHGRHRAQHFAKRNETFSCERCHRTDAGQQVQLVTGFQTACASCHSQSMENGAEEGIALVALPSLDRELLKQSGIDIGSWPEVAQGEFDGELNSIAQMLLWGDARFQAARAAWGETVDLSRLQPDDPQQLRVAGELALSIKELVDDLARHGEQAVARRLTTYIGRELTRDQQRALLADLPITLLRDAARRWFVPAKVELGAATPPAPPPQDGERPTQADVAKAVGAEVLLSDPEPGLTVPEMVESVPFERWPNPLRRTDGDERPAAPVPPTDPPAENDNDSDDLLGDDQLGDDLLGDQDSGDDLLDGSPPDDGAAARESVTDPPLPADYRGWWRDDETAAIRYRPRGHADALARAWIELFVSRTRTANAQPDPRWQQLGTQLGNCTQCHSADLVAESGTARQLIHWLAKRRDPHQKPFTKFSHRPHLIQPRLKDCTYCHEIDPSADVMASYRQGDPRVHANGFLPVSKQKCATCHHPGAAGDGCLKCHNYHVSSSR